MTNNKTVGHLLALFTIVVWSTTYVSTKILLQNLQPIEILVCRFILGLGALFIISPRTFHGTTWKQELTMAAAGLCGICLYYLLENVALAYTTASNAGVIICVAPCFTAILAAIFLKTGKPSLSFYIGFMMAMIGIVLVSWTGTSIEMNPLGDLLALLAALVWGVYSVLTRITGAYGYPTILVTRRMFEYGILFMLPVFFASGTSVNFAIFAQPEILFNMLFLGFCASAVCFVTWNLAVKKIGAVNTSLYIYLTPVITVATAAVFLGERMTSLAMVGAILTLAGLIVSESGNLLKRTHKSAAAPGQREGQS